MQNDMSKEMPCSENVITKELTWPWEHPWSLLTERISNDAVTNYTGSQKVSLATCKPPLYHPPGTLNRFESYKEYFCPISMFSD